MTQQHLSTLRLVVSVLAVTLASGAAAPAIHAQDIQMEVIPTTLTTGLHDGSAKTVELAYQTVIERQDSAWLRLQFGKWDLAKGSFVVLTSMFDDAQQVLGPVELEEWGGTSAFFNGSGVWLQLYVAPGDSGVFADIESIVVGHYSEAESPKTGEIAGCGTRARSTLPAVGRLMLSGGRICTAWLTANSTLLTARHCLGPETQSALVEFDVPDSLPDGTPVHPAPDHQYPVDLGSKVCATGTYYGNDWCVFLASGDPVHAQGSFFRVTEELPDVPWTWKITITGFGYDEGILNHIQQSASEDFIGLYSVQYNGDLLRSWTLAANGNSGGPMLVETSDVAAAIVNAVCGESPFPCETRPGCDPPVEGTSFNNPVLRAALNDYFGDDVLYVDDHHPYPATSGTITRPFADVQSAANSASSKRDRLFIAAGDYNEYVRISNPVKLIAPAGSVRIIGGTSAWE